MSTIVLEQTELDLAWVIAEAKNRHFYFKEVSKSSYKGNWVFVPVDYSSLNHDERKRVGVLDSCGLPVRGFIRIHEVMEVQEIVLPRIQLPWKVMAGAVGAVVAAFLVVPLLMGLVTVIGAILLISAIAVIDPVTVAILEDGTPEGQWLELMFYHEPPAFSIRLSAKR